MLFLLGQKKHKPLTIKTLKKQPQKAFFAVIKEKPFE